MAAAVDHYRREWEAARPVLPGTGVGWIESARREALERFCSQGFPTPRDEDWKYTNVRPIERRPFRLASGEPVVPGALGAERIAGLDAAAALTLVNGRLAARGGPSATSGPPPGVRIDSLARVLAEEPALVEARFAGAGTSNAFSSLNLAFFADGAVVSIAEGVRLHAPIELVFTANSEGEAIASHPLVLVVAGAGARAAIVEHHLGFGPGAKLANLVTRIELGEGAEVDHHLVLEEDDQTWHTGAVEARVAPGAHLRSNVVRIGGRFVRYDIDVSLEGARAHVVLNGLYVARGRQHVDFHTRVDHREPAGTSEQIYKGLLDGYGRGVFNGRVLVHRDAQRSDASQSNHNLLLSENAEIDTKPQLEIFADDVKCSHGATVGQLDEDAIHYLRSRGLGEEIARALLTYGFAEDVLVRIADPAVKRHAERGLVSALPALANLPPLDADGPWASPPAA